MPLVDIEGAGLIRHHPRLHQPEPVNQCSASPARYFEMSSCLILAWMGDSMACLTQRDGEGFDQPCGCAK